MQKSNFIKICFVFTMFIFGCINNKPNVPQKHCKAIDSTFHVVSVDCSKEVRLLKESDESR